MKKKIVALLLCVAMTTAVAGCSNNSGNKGESAQTGTEAVNDTESVAGDVADTEKVTSSSIEFDPKDYVTLGEYKGLPVTLTQDYVVTDAVMADYVNNSIIAGNPYLLEADHDTVQTGDFANIDYEGTKDGEAFAGGTAQGFDLEIGSNSFIDGFEDGLVGMKVGEEKDLNLKFPDDYHSSDMAGQEVVFHVKVNKIQTKKEVTYETFSDEYTTYYATKNGMTYTTAEELLKDVRSYLEGTAESKKASAISAEVLPVLIENSKFETYPEGLLEAAIEEAKDMYVTGYGAMYGSLENIAQSVYNLSLEEFEAKLAEEAEQNLQIEMILDVIAEEEEIELDEELFASYVQNLMTNNSFTAEEDLYLNYADTAEEGKEELKKEYRRIQALSFVVNEADVTIDAGTEAAASTEAE